MPEQRNESSAAYSLPERLREAAERWSPGVDFGPDLIRDAADEIVRLRPHKEKEDARMAEVVRDYVEQLEALDAERYEAHTRLAQVLGWGDFRECSAAQSEEFAEWAKEVGLSHLGNPHIRQELFAEPHVCRLEQTDERTVTCPVCLAVYVLDEDATADERRAA